MTKKLVQWIDETKSAGSQYDRYFDIIGERFGKLIVKRDLGPRSGIDNSNVYECQCDCGATVLKHRSSLHLTLSSCGDCDSTTWTEKIKTPRATRVCGVCGQPGHLASNQKIHPVKKTPT